MTNAADDATGTNGLPPIPPLPPLPELPSFELPDPVGAAPPSDLSATAPLPGTADTTPLPELSESPSPSGAAHTAQQSAPVSSSVPDLADPVFDGAVPPAPPYAPYPPENAGAPHPQAAPQVEAYPVQGYAPPGYAQPGGYPGSYVPPVDGRRANGVAVSGFVVGLVSVFLPLIFGLIGGIVGLVLSIVGVSKHDPVTQTSKGLGIAGIVLSAIAIVFIL